MLEKSESEQLEMFDHISLMTLDSLLKCVMGFHGPTVQLAEGKNEYIDSVYKLSETVVTRLRSPWLRNDFIWSLHPTGNKWRKLCDRAHSFTQGIIDQKKKERANGVAENGTNNVAKNTINKRRKCVDFIDMLLLAKVREYNTFLL